MNSNYFIIHKDNIHAYYTFKEFNTIEEINNYLESIQNIIEENTDFTFYKKTNNNQYIPFTSLYDMQYNVASITIK